MLVTQKYARQSEAAFGGNFFRLNLAAEQGRPPVRLNATIRDGLAYSRLMLGLYQVVTADLRSANRDHSAYQAWVQERYLDELSSAHSEVLAKLPGWTTRRDDLRNQLGQARQRFSSLTKTAHGGSYGEAKQKYFNFLYKYDRDAWLVLDPVISVHPDCLVFEAFSRDESSYGRVTLPIAELDMHEPVQYGTTNIDFSPDLAREIARIRSYRPTSLQVSPQAVGMTTEVGSAVEKKIDLPGGWVRGFLQVQSAAGLPGVDLQLSPSTLADILTELKRKREDTGPRSLRFNLQPGQKPSITIEPWGTVIQEPVFPYTGATAHEIRLWGRRRLLTLANLLPYATGLQVRLLGTGLPSYWSVFYRECRLDLGLSGWTQNDWSRAAHFDLLAGGTEVAPERLETARRYLQEKLIATSVALAAENGWGRETAQAALQQLCRQGQAMFDHLGGLYRWRPLFPAGLVEQVETGADPRLLTARRLLERKAVEWTSPPQKDPPAAAASNPKNSRREFFFTAGSSNKFWAIKLEGDSHTVEFGRVGTRGQILSRSFDDRREAKTSYEKLIREKLSKGYVEKIAPVKISEEVTATGRTRYEALVKGEHDFKVRLDLDLDGRVVYADCTCSDFRHNKLRKGACPHILATSALALEQSPQN